MNGLTNEERRWLNSMPSWTNASGRDIEMKFKGWATSSEVLAIACLSFFIGCCVVGIAWELFG